jgi:hypothetical protein
MIKETAMAAGNWYNNMQMASDLFAIETAVSYTTHSGSGQVHESCVKAIDPAGTITITVADGCYMGQTMIVMFESDSHSQDVVVAYNSTPVTLTVAACYTILMWIGDAEGGDWVVIKEKLT